MRYENQIQVKQIGVEGQKKISDSHILLVGLGGLGSIVAQYLAGAGFGTISVCDSDIVSLPNLHRQTIHNESQLGNLKTTSAIQAMRDINSELNYREFIGDARDLNFGKPTQIIDCTDNKETKIWLNNYARDLGIPLISAGVGIFTAQVYNVLPTQHLRLPELIGNAKNPTSHITVGPVCGVVGSTQAFIAIANAVGIALDYSWLSINVLNFSIRKFTV